ncbi:cytochrome c oxidase subunit 5C [Vitis riparia]|uniref:cytochrome c oxidase subunit 5C n=1 Tax=Vitis riparia TaxID=96939 RepID=UPI00155A8C1D|nr:cytochrome c oxidase subunit 5C [Vitis riparia]
MSRIAHVTLKGPSVVKEIAVGAVVALAAGGLWKMYHWNLQRQYKVFYDMQDKGECTVVTEE